MLPFLRINDHPHPKRAGPGQDRPLAQEDVQRLNPGKFSAGFDDACHQPLLGLKMACARQRVDAPDHWVIVENKRHFITGDHHQMRRDGQAQVQKMCIRHNVIRTVSSDPRGDLQVFQFDVALWQGQASIF